MFCENSLCNTKQTLKFLIGGIILLTVSLSVGTIFGFSAILLPQLENENIMKAKSEKASWIGERLQVLRNNYLDPIKFGRISLPHFFPRYFLPHFFNKYAKIVRYEG